jgi:parvulin-like peptidyl-prolyl isomerase
MRRGFLMASVVVLGWTCSRGPVVASAPPMMGPEVVARWDGGVITQQEVLEAAQRLPTALRDQYTTPNGRKQFIQAVLSKRLLREEARRRGLVDSPEVRAQVEELEERLAIQALLAEAARTAPTTSESELKAYFEAHKADFRSPTRVRISRVLLRGDASDKSLRARAESIRQRAVKGESFARLATLGAGPEATAGGDLGWISEISDDETKAALALKAGEVSAVLTVPSGVAVLRATERQESRDAAFEEVRQLVVGRYAPVQQRKVFDDLVRQLEERAQVQFNTAASP